MSEDEHVIVDFHGVDDAAVVRLNGNEVIVQTVDFFTPIVDDPYDFGQIAAANAISDIYAMGATPLFALNIVAFPRKELPMRVLSEILKGGNDKAKEAGISIVGGHSIDDNEPKYGLVVTGRGEVDRLVKNSTSHPGDFIILTKPLGTGIIATGIKRGVTEESVIAEATKVMTTLNDDASELMLRLNAHAATDVTGFGLLGHLLEMCQASNVSAKIRFKNLPFIGGVGQLVDKEVVPGGTRRNLDYVSNYVTFSERISNDQKIMAADAQTSGGLLITLPRDRAELFVAKFDEISNIKAVIIGEIVPPQENQIIVE